MAAHALFKNEFTEDEKCHNLMRWLIYEVFLVSRILLSTVAFFLLLINMTNLTASELVARRISKMDILRQFQPDAFIGQFAPGTANSTAEQPQSKKEVQHIAFLKVHKAASSTAQNIFLRFGWYRNLTFVLSPAKKPSGYPNVISLRESLTNSNILPPPEGRQYDILCNHVFYSNEAFRKFMPNDTVFIGILREPFDLYNSILNYFRPAYIYKKIGDRFPASTFLRDPLKYEPERLFFFLDERENGHRVWISTGTIFKL